MNVDDLIDDKEPRIELMREWAGRSDANPNIIFLPDPDRARKTLMTIGVTTRSILGAMIFETGGIAIADGLIRLWGSKTLKASQLRRERSVSMTGKKEARGSI